jgi:hypothetical protein
MNQGCPGPVCFYCRAWDLVGPRRSVFLEREEVVECGVCLLIS